MAITKIDIEAFLALSQTHHVLDVRSPGEYQQAHIPGAFSLPLFSDEERKNIGTVYKQQNRETAIKIGLGFFGPNMRTIVETAEKIISEPANPPTRNPQPATHHPPPATVVVHCWRGGMRSAAIAWLLDLYGFKVYTLIGGYKSYRNWVLQQFEKEYPFIIIGGYTGSGKTLLLHKLKDTANAIIDLEALAKHKGSALGGLGPDVQPRQEMFENLLAQALSASGESPAIYTEDESQRIGNLQIPMALWNTMRNRPVCFFDIPFEERLNYLTEEYSVYSKEKLVNAVTRIQKRLGGLETKNAIGFLLEDNHKECFRILLKYYDKYYLKGLYNREHADNLIIKIEAGSVDTENNFELLKKEGDKVFTEQTWEK
ncbi:MAG: tRNA 2-selenouridine(34) synthase MnmH [Ferruginibacter sp.]